MTVPADADLAADRVRQTLSTYAEPLLRQVVQRLLRPRNQWPVDELVERSVAVLTNAAVIDRRLGELTAPARKLLAVVGLSRQPVWRVGHLVAILATLGHAEGLSPVQELLECGLAHPELPAGLKSLRQFEDWLGPSGIASARLFAHPAVTARAAGADLGWPALDARKLDGKPGHHADGLEWLLRAAVAWQRVGTDPVRLTQQQTLFKRDLQRFQADELLASPFAEQLAALPDPGLLALSLAISTGLIEVSPAGLVARPAPELWEGGLLEALVKSWKGLWAVENWDPVRGYQLLEEPGNFPSVALPAFLMLCSVPGASWIQAETIATYLFGHHPSWAAGLKNRKEAAVSWVESLLLGLGQPLRLVEAVQDGGKWWFRLADVGRHLLRGEAAPNLGHDFRQTLVVQPNGELVIFRQGLTPNLLGRLTRFAEWRTIGAACTMELTPESVYRGLETGLTLPDIQRLLDQHGTRSIPATVLDSLQRWSSKRERITVYSSATLLEFADPRDLDGAFARGLVVVKLTDRLGLAPAGEDLDYRHFRLVGNRDYESRPQRCIAFDADGLTFTVDPAQSDLILEAELGRLAEPLSGASAGERRYALTPASLARAQTQGISILELEQWASDRSGEPLSSAARLLFAGSGGQPAIYQKRLVVKLPSESVADGVMQWPQTAALVEERLGPVVVAVTEESLPAFGALLSQIGLQIVGA